ncbi:MAG: bifunctional phosphoribosyl-AMP cyclohydrolase/phosphoribosyl-ATP diphosphatase HisIE [Clostridia bacterium]|nr:bifunctional phosphoribosyl-AMP cyclohydrolase/phosphoribosyl-ATP diphosphatase HisIE [Clostridia bacterium]
MNLKFDANGLIPAIVIDNNSGKVLTLAYMNEESFNKTLADKTTWFYSRSRQCLWHKGETSGNFQHVVKIVADCDSDALAVYVNKDGPACHLGTDSCFENEILYAPEDDKSFCMNDLAALIADRRANPKEGSYTNYLFDKGLDKILKKVGEECTEVIIAAKAEDKKETIYEIADLAYHTLVLMEQAGITVDEIKTELASRHVIDKKVKQEKMT